MDSRIPRPSFCGEHSVFHRLSFELHDDENEGLGKYIEEFVYSVGSEEDISRFKFVQLTHFHYMVNGIDGVHTRRFKSSLAALGKSLTEKGLNTGMDMIR
ncbi:MAG: hypothetical protein COB04_16260 [Gammaproteobacteria bacterium]|nr:MAG: hypothetical protein COB04_16260 [Gammaproteobacteria bacterium]